MPIAMTSLGTSKGIHLENLQANADMACKLMMVLSNRDRLMLFCEIHKGEKCVSELEGNLKILQPTLSQQLGVLRKDGLVKTRREGKQIFYSANSVIAMSVISLLYEHYCSKDQHSTEESLNDQSQCIS